MNLVELRMRTETSSRAEAKFVFITKASALQEVGAMGGKTFKFDRLESILC